MARDGRVEKLVAPVVQWTEHWPPLCLLFMLALSKKIGLDPAVLAGPITTSIVDVVGLIIYFKIALFILPVLRL